MTNHYENKYNFSIELEIIIDNNNCNSIIKPNQPIHTKDFQTINIDFFTEQNIKEPKLSDKVSFYIIYSPEKNKLRPRDSIMLNLQKIQKVHLPEQIEETIGLLPTFVSRKLSIKNSNWILNKRKDEAIHLDILNKDFYNTTNISKKQEIDYILLLNQKKCEKIVATYNIFKT